MPITSTGLGSGLDIESIITGLVDAEKAPVEQSILRQEAEITETLTGFSQLRGVLGGLQTAAASLATASTFDAVSVVSSDTSKVTATATDGVVGSYDLEVTSLATAQNLTSGDFAATSDTVGTGTLTIAFGTPSYAGTNPDTYSSFSASTASSVTVTISSDNSSLTGVRDAINAATDQVAASIVQVGSNYRLMLTSTQTGLENSMSITVSDSSDGSDVDNSGLSQLAYSTAASNLTQTAAAVDAAFKVNGLSLSSATNTVSDVIPGATFELVNTTSSPVSLRFSADTSTVTSAVEEFVSKYNSYITEARQLVRFNSVTGEAGLLQGDATARSTINSLTNALARSISTSATYSNLVELGITTQADGTLKLNSSTLSAKLAESPSAVEVLLAGGTVGDEAITGVAEDIETRINDYLKYQGTFDTKADLLEERSQSIAEQRENLAKRLERVEARFRAQFNAMDSLLSQLTTTGTFLESQFNSLPGFNSKNDD